MSYQVLARKWRPKSFADLAGQEHVVTALANALDKGRLHHAYLLTGTRGVGKTTIARILAKSLNCMTKGVSATPCGTCAACADIDAGRFIDLLELDAASNTGIDDMRAILDNARYAPTVGRYKVYLIDEVHQLSKAAFNSMLKTLEEPPEHVKFVLATTDPQKIPVTVLSRCLQFNLKPLPPPLLGELLAKILVAEAIAHDAGAIALIARAAQGSARDALSLLDQAIAYGGGQVQEPVVRTMLGTVDRDFVYRIATALATGDGKALLAEGDALAARGLAAAAALDELGGLFHRIAIAQLVPEAATNFDEAAQVKDFTTRFTPETVQLAYQICAQGRADLALAPDENTGFSMTLLRLLAFHPEGAKPVANSGPARAPTRSATPPTVAAPAPIRSSPAAATLPVGNPSAATSALPDNAAAWPPLVAGLKLTGMAAQLAAQTEWRGLAGATLTLALPAAHRHLADKAYADKLRTALEQACGRRLLLAFEVGDAIDGSLASKQQRERVELQAVTEAQFKDEPFVRDALARFDAKIKPDSIKPLP